MKILLCNALSSLVVILLFSLGLLGQDGGGNSDQSQFELLGNHDGFGTFRDSSVLTASDNLKHVTDSLGSYDFLVGGGSSYILELNFEQGYSLDAVTNNYINDFNYIGGGYLIFFVDYQDNPSGSLTYELILPEVGHFANLTALRRLYIRQQLQNTFDLYAQSLRSEIVSNVIRKLTLLLREVNPSMQDPTGFGLHEIFFEDSVDIQGFAFNPNNLPDPQIVANVFDYSLLSVNSNPLESLLNGPIDLTELGIDVYFSSNSSIESSVYMSIAAQGFYESLEEVSLWVHFQFDQNGDYIIYAQTKSTMSRDDAISDVYDHFDSLESNPSSILDEEIEQKAVSAKLMSACDGKPSDFSTFQTEVSEGRWWHGKDWTMYCFFADNYTETPIPSSLANGLELYEQTVVGTYTGLADGLLGMGFGIASLLKGIEHVQSLNPASISFWRSLIVSAYKSESLKKAWNLKFSQMKDLALIVWSVVKFVIQGPNYIGQQIAVSIIKYFQSISGSSALFNASYIAGLILFEVLVEILTGGAVFAARVASTLSRLGKSASSLAGKLTGIGFNGIKKILDTSRWARFGDEIVQGMKNFDVLPNRKRTCASIHGQCFAGGTLVLLAGGLGAAPIESVEPFDLVQSNVEHTLLYDDSSTVTASLEDGVYDMREVSDEIVVNENWYVTELVSQNQDTLKIARPESWYLDNRIEHGLEVNISLPDIGVDDQFSLYKSRLATNKELQSLQRRGEIQPVLTTISRTASSIINVVTSQDVIRVTSEHPFYSNDKNGWVEAGKLVAGENIKTLNGRSEVLSIEVEKKEDIRVHNLEINFNHNYYVGGGQYLVHNTCRKFVQKIVDDYPNGGTVFKGQPGSSALTNEVDELGTFIANLPSNAKSDLLYDLGRVSEATQGVIIKKVRAWEVAFNCPQSIRTNIPVLESLSGAINRGTQNVQDALSSIPNFPEMTLQRAEHILRGNGGPIGGVHHVSALLARSDLSLKDIETILPNGSYKARVQFPGGQYPPKDFFPDSWSETKVLEEIKSAVDNGLTVDPTLGTNAYRGVTSEGVDIVVYRQSPTGPIISAHPIIP